MLLSECHEGDNLVVRHVRGGGGALRKRLLEMGLVGGARVSIVKYAPLRDPIELALGDAHVSLRVSEAAAIEVEVAGLAIADR